VAPGSTIGVMLKGMPVIMSLLDAVERYSEITCKAHNLFKSTVALVMLLSAAHPSMR